MGILAHGGFGFAKEAPPTPEEILKQERPESWPEWVDVEMDASILTDETLKQGFKECFSKAPSLMLELSDEALFGKGGIYPKEADPTKETKDDFKRFAPFQQSRVLESQFVKDPQ